MRGGVGLPRHGGGRRGVRQRRCGLLGYRCGVPGDAGRAERLCRLRLVGREAASAGGLGGGFERGDMRGFFFSPTGAGCVLEMSRRCCRLSSGLWPWSYSNVPIRPYAGSGSLLVKWIGTRSELCYCLVLVINLVDVNYLIIIAL